MPGFTFSPRATALRASKPAPIITEGFDVLVQLVIAAIAISPSPGLELSFLKAAGASRNGTRS